MSTKLLFFAGSARKDSVNKKLAKAAYDLAVAVGADATFIDLVAYPMPIYDGDLEDAEGLPENAQAFKDILSAHDGFFIASPEYNSAIAPLLKNVIDWASRPSGEVEAPLIAYKGKVAALVSASPGGLGGMRGLVSVCSLLGNIGMHVIPEQVAVGGAFQAFNDDGSLSDERQAGMLKNVVEQFISTTKKIRG